MEIARSFEVRHHGNIRSETLHDHSGASAYRYAGGFSAFAWPIAGYVMLLDSWSKLQPCLQPDAACDSSDLSFRYRVLAGGRLLLIEMH